MDYIEPNPDSDLYNTFKALPKIDLHRHLEGSLRLSTMAETAQEVGLDLPGYNLEDFRHMVQITPDDPASADAFLAKFKVLRHFYRSREIIERIAYEAVADAAADNICYLELRFTPAALSRYNDYSMQEVTEAVIASVQRAEADHDIDVGLILSMNRNESVELGEVALNCALANLDSVVGLDLAGAEHEFSGVEFAPLFERAREAGMEITIHAGEWAGPESVRTAIFTLGAARLGHGVRILSDLDLVLAARERGTLLEVCPTSNVQSGVVRSHEEHPLFDLYRMGLRTTINTDDPSISGICLTDECVTAVEHLGLTVDDVKQHMINAARAAFLPDDRRDALVSRLQADLKINPANLSATPA